MTATSKVGANSQRRVASLEADSAETYLALVEANHRRPVTEAFRDDAERHRSTRPCPACRVSMVDGACDEHGTPAEDRGDWLWARWSR